MPVTKPNLPTPFLDTRRGYVSDWITQTWVRITGRRVVLADAEWLRGPAGETQSIGCEYFHAYAAERGLNVSINVPGSGLMPRFTDLSGPRFRSEDVCSEIIAFYEHTSEYQLKLWTQWSVLFRPFGQMVSYLFSRRLRQLNLPASASDTRDGITSDIVQLRAPNSEQTTITGWLRTIRATEEVIYVGIYSVAHPPQAAGPCVKVVFPLPNGSASVFLRPEAGTDGSLRLVSAGRAFGDAGFYFIVYENENTAFVKYLPMMHETLHVTCNEQNELHTAHTFRLWGHVFLKMQYTMTRKQPSL